jgi:hypothetical protein
VPWEFGSSAEENLETVVIVGDWQKSHIVLEPMPARMVVSGVLFLSLAATVVVLLVISIW